MNNMQYKYDWLNNLSSIVSSRLQITETLWWNITVSLVLILQWGKHLKCLQSINEQTFSYLNETIWKEWIYDSSFNKPSVKTCIL